MAPERAEIFLISLSYQDFFDEMYSSLIDSIDKSAKMVRAKSSTGAIRYLESHNPQAILITDEGITEPANATVLEMVLSYVKNGGRAIFGLHFTSFINMDSFNKLFHEVFGLPWQRGDYHRATFRFNPSCTLPAGTVKNSMRFDYSMKVLHIMGAASHEKIFVPVPGGMTQSAVFPPSHVDESQAAVVGAKIGDGFLAYCGDVNAEAGSDKVILALCVL